MAVFRVEKTHDYIIMSNYHLKEKTLPLQTQKYGSSEKDSISAEIKKLTTNAAVLESRSITLYEKFADEKIDRDTYVSAKTENSKSLEETQTRIFQLSQRLAEININASLFENTADEPILHRVLNATEVTSEVLARRRSRISTAH